MFENSVRSLVYSPCAAKVLLYDVTWSQTDFECLILNMEENSILLVYAAKYRLLKLLDPDPELEADKPNHTRDQ